MRQLNGIIIFIFINIAIVKSQTTLQLFYHDPCTDTVGILEHYVLLKDTSQIFYVNEKSKTVTLPSTGCYELSSIYFSGYSIQYNIEKEGQIVDTVRGEMIQFLIEPTTNPSYSGYFCCDKECEGWQIDYYPNNIKRIEGFFRNGKPIGKLTFYHPNGNVKRIDKYDNGKLRKRTFFSQDGKLEKTEKY